MTGTVLLTGATGFVGRQVLANLMKRHSKVRLLSRSTELPQGSPLWQIDSIMVTPDLCAEPLSWWISACRDVDTVIHLAWYAEPGKYLQSPRNLDCLRGTLDLAKACVEAGVRRFIGIGTCFEYDLNYGHLSIETPLHPTTPYAATKAAAFLSLSQHFSVTNVEFAWCRLFYLYGDGEDERRLVPYLRKRLANGQVAELTSGTQVRDFMDVRDAGCMIADVALGHAQGPINICSGQGITVKELAERIADEYGRRDLLRFGARPDNLVDPPYVVGVRTRVDA